MCRRRGKRSKNKKNARQFLPGSNSKATGIPTSVLIDEVPKSARIRFGKADVSLGCLADGEFGVLKPKSATTIEESLKDTSSMDERKKISLPSGMASRSENEYSRRASGFEWRKIVGSPVRMIALSVGYRAPPPQWTDDEKKE